MQATALGIVKVRVVGTVRARLAGVVVEAKRKMARTRAVKKGRMRMRTISRWKRGGIGSETGGRGQSK